MTKHDQFRFYQLATILVAVYIGFIVLVNLVIAQQQDAMLKERGADYALIIKQPQFDRQKWLRQNGLQVLTPKSPNKTKLQKAVTDIVNRNHSAANFSTRQTVNKQPYLFYA
ncbi:MAG: two-component sensor histidine kinase, partial [Latilactobacillus curvatus]|nr:two-component sensor histidine kinase [Latilactobacillus curvatus]